MSKPTEVRSDADLQAIQTSVAFKNISDAIEQYRRQFGFAFLALIAFSAIHVGLVVIANLYTLETRVENGVLTAAKSSTVGTPTPVATAALEHSSNLEYVMSSVDAAKQKQMISSIKSVDFVDNVGDYRQYTVTGFKLSGFKNSELSLFTSVGHVLEYVRGKGLRVSTETQSCNCTSDHAPGRKLLTSLALNSAINNGWGDHITDRTRCLDELTTRYTRVAGEYVDALGQVNVPKADLAQFADDARYCTFKDGVGFSMSEADNDYSTALSKHMQMAREAARSSKAILTQLQAEVLAAGDMGKGEGLDWNSWDNQNCYHSKFGAENDASCNILKDDLLRGSESSTVLLSVADMSDPVALKDFMSNFDNTCKGDFVKNEFALFAQMYTGGSKGANLKAGENSAVGQWLDQAIDNTIDNAAALQTILQDYTSSSKSWKSSTLSALVRAIVHSQAEVGDLDSKGQLSRAGLQFDPEYGWMDPKKLRTEQQIFEMGAQLALALWQDLSTRANQKAEDCAKSNANNSAIISMTFMTATIDYLDSNLWSENTAQAFADSWETAQIVAGQQSTKCAQAASECFFSSHAHELGALCQQGVAAEISDADCSLVQSGMKEVYGIDGSVTTVPLARCGSAGSRSMGCSTEPLFDMYHTQATQDFDDAQASADMSATLGSSAINKYTAWIAGTIKSVGTGDVVTIIEGWVDSFVNVRMYSLLDSAGEEWINLKSSNMWDKGKTVEAGTAVYGDALGFGCSSTSAYSMSAYDTLIPVMAIAACKVESGNTHKLPMVNGAMFSSILGSYDSYSIYVPPKMCAMVNNAMTENVQRQMELISANLGGAADQNAYVDYVIMLHGWGGTNAWMNTISLVFNYGMNGKHGWSAEVQDFDVCNTMADMAIGGGEKGGEAGCVSHVAPGGFAIIAPNAGSMPVGCRHWWFNSEFSGFVLDYVVFDLPANFLHMTGVEGRTASVFGFSMGGWGVLLVLNTFPKLVAAAAAYNAPLYPASCFFAYICHHACITDPIYCEILFTTMGMVINSYVIIFQDGAVASSGSMDPMGAGVAVQLAKSPSGQHLIECRKSDSGAQAEVEKVQTLDWTGTYVGVANMQEGIKVDCSNQNWNSVEAHGDGCDAMLGLMDKNNGFMSEFPGKSIHVNIPAMTRDLSNYKCLNCNYAEATKPDPLDPNSIIQGGDLYKVLFGYGSRNGEEASCPMSMCDGPGYDWCAEANDAEDSGGRLGNYLSPVHLTVATMKFVPQSNAITESAVPSAFREVFFASPATKFMNSVEGQSSSSNSMRSVSGPVMSVYGVSTVMLYLHCSQNDEAGNYVQHLVYAGMILGASHGDWSAGDGVGKGMLHWDDTSQFLIDFEDCDGHFYSERDIKSTLMWLSDAVRSFVGDVAGDQDFNVIRDHFLGPSSIKRFDYLKTCWLSKVGDGSAAHFGGSYASGYAQKNEWTTITQAGVNCALDGVKAIHSGKGWEGVGEYPSVYTDSEWHDIEKGNEVHVEAQHVIELMSESEKILTAWENNKVFSCSAALSQNPLFMVGTSVVKRSAGSASGDQTQDGLESMIGPGPTSQLCRNDFIVWVDDDGSSHSSDNGCMGLECM